MEYNKNVILLDVVSNFIDKNIGYVNSYEEAFKGFMKLESLFDDIFFISSFDFSLNLISINNNLDRMCSLVWQSNQMETGNSLKFLNITKSFLEIYRIVHNIGLTPSDTMYLKELNNLPPLTSKEEIQLGYRLLKGDKEAKNILIERNLRFVYYIANLTIKEHSYLNLPLSDLVQEGNIGLIMCVDSYDVRSGYRFLDYAISSIKKAIDQYIVSNIDLNNQLISITSINDNNSEELQHFYSTMEELDNNIITKDMQERVNEYLNNFSFSSQEKKFLQYHFGLGKAQPMSLLEISNIMNLSEKQVTIIRENVLHKLRCDKRINQFVDFMDDPNKALYYITNYIPKNYNYFSSIYGFCTGYTKEEVDDVLSNFSDHEISLLKLRYGDKLDSINQNCQVHLEKKFYLTICKLRNELEIKYGPTKKIQPPASDKRKLKTIYDFCPEYLKEEVDIVLSELNNDDMQLLYERYGPDLSNPLSNGISDYNRKNSFFSLVERIKRRLLKVRCGQSETTPLEIRTIYDLCGDYTKKEIDHVIYGLSNEEQALLYRRYGFFLDQSMLYNVSKTDMYNLYKILLPKIKKRLVNLSLYGKVHSPVKSKKHKK